MKKQGITGGRLLFLYIFILAVLGACIFYPMPVLDNPLDPMRNSINTAPFADRVLLESWVITEQLYDQYICCRAGVEKQGAQTVLLGNYGNNTVYLYDADFNVTAFYDVGTNMHEAMGIYKESLIYYVSGESNGNAVVNEYSEAWSYMTGHTIATGEAAWNVVQKDGNFYVLLGASCRVMEFASAWNYTGNVWTLALPEQFTEMTSLFWIETDSQWIAGYRNGHDSGGGLAAYDEGFNYIASNYLETYDNQGMWYDGVSTLEFYSNHHDTVFRVEKQ